jgi:inositol transporter-like SP family MFS transporter
MLIRYLMSNPDKYGDVDRMIDEVSLKRTYYYWTVLGALANYLDVGAIVAGAASLPIW